MHKVIVIGNTTRDAAGNEKVARFGMASTEGKDITMFFNCVAFPSSFSDKQFETLSKLEKGRMLFVEGCLRDGKYEKDGKEIKTQDLIVSDFRFLGSGKKPEAAADAAGTKAGAVAPSDKKDSADSELPF